MAQSTVIAVGAGFIVAGLLTSYGGASLGGGLAWVVGGVVAIVAGMATKNMK